MRHPYKYLALSAVLLVMLSSCATYHVRQGNRLFNSLAYTDAIVEYQKALGKKNIAEAQIKLAESYRLTNNTLKAEEAYGKVVQMKECEPIHKLRYAQMLMRNGKYNEAKTWYDKYIADMPNDNSAKQLRASCDSIDEYKKDSTLYTVSSIGVNTGQTNFSPRYYKDGIVFASDRASGKMGQGSVYPWTGQPYLDLYYAKADKSGNFSAPEKMRGDVNGIYHDGPCAFSGDSVMYFTRNNYVKKKTKKSTEDVVNFKICKATRKDSLWTNIEEFPFNSSEYNTGHPTLSKDGNTMYFVSDMPGGTGGSDIYITKKENGTWSKPVNMGPNVNTTLNEAFPTVFRDTILYFSSEGHTNMGGLDIFYTTRNASDQWGEASNMRYPINSSYDDFGVIMNDSAYQGYFSSNRNTANTMQDNIYGFTKLFFTLEGIAVEKISQQPLSGVMVELTNETTGEKIATMTGDDGKFMFMLAQNSDFSVVGSKDDFFTNTEKVTTKDKKVSENMFVKLKLELERIIVNKPIVLENIYYDLDKWDIRPDAAAGLDKLVTILKENGDIKIELGSHTDSRADDSYNMKLSQKRAESAVNYIVSRGISKDRITAKGYGESMLVNGCKNNVKCTEEEHQQNRRTEFKVVGFVKDNKTSQK